MAGSDPHSWSPPTRQPPGRRAGTPGRRRPHGATARSRRPAADRLLTRIASDIGAAVDAVEAFWGADWSRDISVVVAGSDDEFRAAAGGGPPSQWADIAAVTVADRSIPPPGGGRPADRVRAGRGRR